MYPALIDLSHYQPNSEVRFRHASDKIKNIVKRKGNKSNKLETARFYPPIQRRSPTRRHIFYLESIWKEEEEKEEWTVTNTDTNTNVKKKEKEKR